MNQPEAPRAAEADVEEIERSDRERVTFSPLDPAVEAPINAAVHFDDKQGTEGGTAWGRRRLPST
jgi:hypothetical protein